VTITVPEVGVSSTGSALVSIGSVPAVGDVVIYHVFSARAAAPRAVLSVAGLGGTWTALSNPAGTRSSWWISTDCNASGNVTATFDFGTPTPSATAWIIRGLPAGYSVLDLDDTQGDPVVALAGPTQNAELFQIALAHGRCAQQPIVGPTAVSPATGWVENGSSSNSDSAYRIPTAVGPAAHRVDYGSPLSGMMLASQIVMGVPAAPLAVTGLTQIGQTLDSVTVAYTAPGSGTPPTSYQRNIDGGAWVTIGNVVNATITGLSPSTTYSIGIRAIATGSAGPGPATYVDATTEDAPAPPNPPTELVQTEATPSSVAFSFSPPEDGAIPTGYEYELDASEPIPLGLSTTAERTGLAPESDYTVRARTLASTGESEWSEPLVVSTTAYPPRNVECFEPVRGSGLRVTELDNRGAVGETVRYATSKSVVKVTINEVVDSAKNETIKSPEGAKRLRLTKPAKTIRNTVDVDFIRVDPGVLSLVAGVELIYRPDPDALGFGEGEFGMMFFGGAEGQVVGFEVGTRLTATSFALEVWSKLGGQRCVDGSPMWGYTLFPSLRGGRISGFRFTNGLVSFNLRGAQTRRSPLWDVGPYDLEGPFERLTSLVSRNTSWRMFMTPATPPAEVCGVQEFTPAVLDNGTAANPMPDPDAPTIVDGGGAITSAWIIEGGRA